MKFAEAAPEQQRIKARFVALGNVLFDEWLRVRRNLAATDFWAPLCSLLFLRLISARATAHRRRAQLADLIKAYPQTRLGGTNKHYLIVPDKFVATLPGDLADKFRWLAKPA